MDTLKAQWSFVKFGETKSLTQTVGCIIGLTNVLVLLLMAIRCVVLVSHTVIFLLRKLRFHRNKPDIQQGELLVPNACDPKNASSLPVTGWREKPLFLILLMTMICSPMFLLVMILGRS